MRFVKGALAAVFLLGLAASAQERAPRVYKDRITPQWFANNTKFWYRNELPGGLREYIVIDAATGARERMEKAPEGEEQGDLRAQLEPRPSSRTGPETRSAFHNKRAAAVELFWIGTAVERKSSRTHEAIAGSVRHIMGRL